MKQILDKYADKLVNSGLSDEGFPLIGGLDAELIWNRKDPHTEELAKVFDKLNINSLLYSKPAEPYYSIIEYLITQAEDTIYPNDCETRTFMHDIPVIRSFNAEQIADRLKQRKSVIIEGYGIVTWGTVSPEQAFIFYSSVCFACFVKFFCDYLYSLRYGSVSIGYKKVFEKVIQKLDVFTREPLSLMQAPFQTEEEEYKASAISRESIVFHEGQQVGYVEIVVASDVYTQLQSQFLWASTITLFVNLVCLLIAVGFLLRRLLTKPLQQANEAVSAYGR